MKVFKWLKRDRSDRRSSDTAVMVASPDTELSSSRDRSSGKIKLDDPIRTDEYKQALADFIARRSLGPNMTFHTDKIDGHPLHPATPELSGKNFKKDDRRTQSEQKPKRRSLPDSNSQRSGRSDLTSSNVPQIQFLFSNQIFMPGSGNSLKKNKPNKQKSDKSGSLISTSPDLLPPRFLRDKHVEFDECDSLASPPKDFFKGSSLPYVDKPQRPTNFLNIPLKEEKRTSPDRTSELRIDEHDNRGPSPGERDPSLRHVIEELKNLDNLLNSEYSGSDSVDTSFGSVARKLEQMCQKNYNSNQIHFRGIPFVKAADIKYECEHIESSFNKDDIHWNRGSWMCMPIIVKQNPKSWCTPGLDISLDEFVARDIDVLTKIRHPSILLLMGLCYNHENNIQSIYEESIGTLNDYIHKEGNILSCQTSLRYINGIASALLYLKSNNYIHTSVSSHTILLTTKDVAKLSGFELCSQIINKDDINDKNVVHNPYKLNYSSEPEYENLKDLQNIPNDDYNKTCKKSLTKDECVPQDIESRLLFVPFRWQAPELFDDCGGLVYPCKKTDVYSLCLVLWECCNRAIPWKNITYDELAELYFTYETGIRLLKNSKYPPPILNILLGGLPLSSTRRLNMEDVAEKIKQAMINMNDEEEFIISRKSSKDTQEDIFLDDGDNSENSLLNFQETDEDKSKQSKRFIMKMKNIKKYQVTDLDKEDVEISKILSSSHFYAECNASETKSAPSFGNDDLTESTDREKSYQDIYNSNSTEYCSVATPEVKRFMFRKSNTNLNIPTKLVIEESSLNAKERILPDNIIKLNSSIVPKSYKPLQIEPPAVDKLNSIRRLTKSFESNRNTEKKSQCVFDIQNVSLPITPIARNTKIRKNAWLSGEDDLIYNTKNTFNLSDSVIGNSTEKDADISCNSAIIKSPMKEIKIEKPNALSKSINSSISPNITSQIVNRGRRRHSLVNLKYDPPHDAQESDTNNMSLLFRQNYSDVLENMNEFNMGIRRNRSQSLNCKPGSKLKLRDNIVGVDIKPLVAIHEKWIMERRHQSGRSSSLPENYRGNFLAVKPASHLLDPVRSVPKNSRESDGESKNKTIESSPVLQATNAKKGIKRSANFYENSLWRKEKEKCLSQIKNKSSPQSCSTPLKKNEPKVFSLDKFTNTDSYEELCKKIMFDTKKSVPVNQSFAKSPMKPFINTNLNNTCPDFIFKNAKTSMLAELTNAFDRISTNSSEIDNKKSELKDIPVPNQLNGTTNISKNIKDSTCTKLKNPADNSQSVPAHFTKQLFDQIVNNSDKLILESSEDTHSFNDEDDCVSLPDNMPQQISSDEICNKALKRCQAFTALQDARSTEDMYIDDELTSHMDMQTFSENMQLIPLQSHLHEAMCDKGKECCLIKIQDEVRCDRLLLFCDNSNKNKKPNSNDSSYCNSDDEDYAAESSDKKHPNLHIHNLPPIDLIDLTPANNPLPVIEERSGEEDNSETESVASSDRISAIDVSSRPFKDLISMYESDHIKSTPKNCKSGISSRKHFSNETELSILILDDDVECDNKSMLMGYCDERINMSDPVVDDIIQV